MKPDMKKQHIRSLELRLLDALDELIEKVRNPESKERLRLYQIRLHDRLRRQRHP